MFLSSIGRVRRLPHFFSTPATTVFVALAFVASAVASTVLPPEFSTLVNDSDYIVHAVTKAVVSEKQTGPRGTRIVTHVELEVIEVVAGTPPAKITLDFLGGRVGEEKMTVGGMPHFEVGNEDILFVSGNGRTICPLYAMMHGRYSVESNADTARKYVARADGMPLQSTAQISSPLTENAAGTARQSAATTTALEPADFIRQIKTTLRPDARSNRGK